MEQKGVGVNASDFRAKMDKIAEYILGYIQPLDKLVFEFMKRVLQMVYSFDSAVLPSVLLQILVWIIGIFSTFRAPDFFNHANIGVITNYSTLDSTYDYVVVGGGIAGCLMARRLSDNKFTVLLVHGPGGTPNILTRAPFTALVNYGNPQHDHLYQGPVIPTSYWSTQRVTYNAGKDLGGSQILSGQVWSYGKSGDYQCWKRYNISNKFNYINIRKFGALHENADRAVKGVDFAYGRNGEIHISHPDEGGPYSELADMFQEAGAKVTGTKSTPDHNSDQLGFSRMIHAVERETGYISTPTRAFFEKGYNREKLHIVTKHMATKILFDKTVSPPRAVGIQIRRLSDNQSFNVTARRKVVLTAGAVRTPQLLTLSGVGPAKVMRKFNVPPVAVREGVGRNLHDHYDIGSGAVCLSDGKKGFADFSLSETLRFTLNGTGIIRVPYGIYSAGFFRSTSQHSTCKRPINKWTCRPDFELILLQIGPNTQLAAKHYLSSGITNGRMKDDFYMMNKEDSQGNTTSDLYDQRECLMYIPTLLHPEGRGNIALTTGSPLDNPVINIDPTTNKRDMLLMGELYQIIKRISDEGFVSKGGAFNKKEFKECKHIADKRSTEYGACQIKPYLKTAWHMSGTCRLGQKNDLMAVVDESFHVIGVEDLVVADGSLLPCPTSGHMIATVSALAEMAANDLLRTS